MDIKEFNVDTKNETQKQSEKQNHPWEYARAKVIKHLTKRFLSKTDKGYIIDIGCGDIFFLNRFCQSYNGYTPVAVDSAFNEQIIASLKKNSYSKDILFCNDINQIELNGETAKVIFLMDVIEHIEDDVKFLDMVSHSDFVGDETIFVITVPAFNSLYCSHDKWLGHFRRYNNKMLVSHVKAAGLSPVKVGYFFTSLLIPRFFQKQLEKIKKEQKEVTGIGDWKGGKLISKLYETVLLIDFYFFNIFRTIGIKMPGLSVYAICKKNKS